MSNIIHESYENGKRKNFFSYIKSLRTDFCGVDTLQKDNVLHSNNQDKANVTSQQFLQRVVILFCQIWALVLILILTELKYSKLITIAGVKNLLGLDQSKSPGPDKIPGKLLKVMASGIVPCLSLVFCCFPPPRYIATRLETSFGNSTT